MYSSKSMDVDKVLKEIGDSGVWMKTEDFSFFTLPDIKIKFSPVPCVSIEGRKPISFKMFREFADKMIRVQKEKILSIEETILQATSEYPYELSPASDYTYASEKNKCQECISHWKENVKKLTTKNSGQVNLEAIRAISIENFLSFNGAGFTKCLWHEEKTPSLHYDKKKNRVKCFGCGKYANIIDVVMVIHTCDFKRAIQILGGK